MPTSAPTPYHHRPYRWRGGSTSRLSATPDREALTETARAIRRGIKVLEGMDRRERPSAPRSTGSGRRALSAAPVPAR